MPKKVKLEKLINQKEAIKLLGVDRKTLFRHQTAGNIAMKKVGRSNMYKKNDILKLAKTIIDNRDKYRPDIKEFKEPTAMNVVDYMKEDVDGITLNKRGELTLMMTTQRLKDNELLSSTAPHVLMAYALAVQIYDKYIDKAMVANDGEEKYYFDIAKMFIPRITNYENALGLTPLALSRIKPIEKKVIDIDPMEALLRGD